MPLYPGNDDDNGVTIDYGSTAMMPVWDAIEDDRTPGDSPHR